MTKIYDFEVLDRCLYWKKKKTLIIGDLHLGYESSLSERGYSVPRTQKEENYDILRKIIEKLKNKIERIIFLGDIKHYFGGIFRQEFEDFENLIKFIEKELGTKPPIVITKGNHDNMLQPILANYKNIRLVDYLLEEKRLFVHGDSESTKKCYEIIKSNRCKLVVLGHFHPAFVLKDKKGVKEEKFKCFLYGYSNEFRKEVIFVPSFFPLIEGSDVIKDLEIYEKGMKILAITTDGKNYLFDKI
ncbi:metallophosphoesterase [Candidatus Pacearchaeota archaeon]|nr:metallophosphoesterase [Candidatus Pacearchaeota archaeon]